MDRMQISLLVVRIMDIDGFSFHHEHIKCRRIQKSSSAMACCTAAAFLDVLHIYNTDPYTSLMLALFSAYTNQVDIVYYMHVRIYINMHVYTVNRRINNSMYIYNRSEWLGSSKVLFFRDSETGYNHTSPQGWDGLSLSLSFSLFLFQFFCFLSHSFLFISSLVFFPFMICPGAGLASRKLRSQIFLLLFISFSFLYLLFVFSFFFFFFFLQLFSFCSLLPLPK